MPALDIEAALSILETPPEPRDGHDPVNHPEHYMRFSHGAEVIDIVENLSFNFGAVVKYICRAEFKGSREEDLKKGLHFYARELNRLGIDFSDVDLTWGRRRG